MPAMYPEELAKLRADHPNLQYDFRGNVTGVSPAYTVSSLANDIRGIMNGYQQPSAWDFGPTRNDYLNSKDFVGPMSQQWWDPNGELAQQGLGALVSGQDLPDVGFYSQWDPNTNSWVRHGAPSDVYRQPGYGGAVNPSYGGARRQRGFVPAGPGYEKPDNPYMKFSDRPASGGQDVLGDFPDMYGA